MREVYCRNEGNTDHTVANTGSLLQKWKKYRSCRRKCKKSTAEMKNLRIVPKELLGIYCRNGEFANHTEGIAGSLLQKWRKCRSCRRKCGNTTAEMENLRIIPKKSQKVYGRNRKNTNRTEEITRTLLQNRRICRFHRRSHRNPVVKNGEFANPII